MRITPDHVYVTATGLQRLCTQVGSREVVYLAETGGRFFLAGQADTVALADFQAEVTEDRGPVDPLRLVF